MNQLKDSFGRIHNYVRISLTDRCNLNCIYCNPANNPLQISPKSKLPTFEEIKRLITIFVTELSVNKIRFTGGEPLARKNIIKLFELISDMQHAYNLELGLTTNGTMLEDKLLAFKFYGINKLNISLDTLNKEKFIKITGKDNLDNVISSIEKAENLGFIPLKLNCVVMKGINDKEVLDFIDRFKNNNLYIRFIEYMPFSGNGWNDDKFINYMEIKKLIASKYDLVEFDKKNNSVSIDYSLNGYKAKVSFINSISNHFCDSCNRLRITANGKLKLCLFSHNNNQIDFVHLFRNTSHTNTEIANIIVKELNSKEYQHPQQEELVELKSNNMISIGG